MITERAIRKLWEDPHFSPIWGGLGSSREREAAPSGGERTLRAQGGERHAAGSASTNRVHTILRDRHRYRTVSCLIYGGSVDSCGCSAAAFVLANITNHLFGIFSSTSLACATYNRHALRDWEQPLDEQASRAGREWRCCCCCCC